MFAVFQIQNAFMLMLTLVLFVFQAWAFIDAVARRPDAFVAADKLTKPGWMLILIVFTLSQIFQGWLSFFGLIGIVASAVYLVDARPALRAAAGRGRGGWGIRRRRGPRPL